MPQENVLRTPTTPPAGHWTEEQWQAIHTGGSHLLVAAAAGAGKTAVLVERIIQSILHPENPTDVDRLLVVTFTDAAATQMRDRIAQALADAAGDPSRPASERERLQRQLTLIDRAAIQTLHSFCLWLLRRYFYLVDIDPLFRILDSEEASLLQFEVVDALLEEEYSSNNPGDALYNLIDAYRVAHGDAGVRQTILQLHAYSMSIPDAERWFSDALQMYDIAPDASIDELPWIPTLMRSIRTELAAAKEAIAQATRLALEAGVPPRAQQILSAEHALISNLEQTAHDGSWQALYDLLSPEPKFQRLSFAGFDDDATKLRIQAWRNDAKDLVIAVARSHFARSAAEELTLLQEIRPHVAEIIRLVQRFGRRYDKAKHARGVLDFNDLERLAYAVLQAPAPDGKGESPGDQLRTMFSQVMVDEYQDINPLQDAILRQVARGQDEPVPNLFMVGDVKQSIYRFRLADPTLFMERQQTFTPYAQACTAKQRCPHGVVIDLKANFRSRPSVIDGVNYVFRQILTPGVGELAYDTRAELVAGLDAQPRAREAVEFHLLERDSGAVPAAEPEAAAATNDQNDDVVSDASAEWEQRSALEREALLTADLVHRLVAEGAPVYDREKGEERPARYGDIAVLLRSTRGRANVFIEALRSRDIPAYAQLGTGFFWAVEIETMLAVLRVIDNPRQDIPLAAVLRAPWNDYCTEQLAEIRLAAPQEEFYDAVRSKAAQSSPLGQRLAATLAQLERWRTQARLAPLGELLHTIYRETAYPEYVQGLPGGEQRRVNLQALQQRAARFDGFTQGGLARFLRFIDSLQEEEGDLGEAPLLGAADDVVQIMSIHKSKGLEFPIVIVADLGKGFNLTDTHGAILYHNELGIAPLWSDAQLGLRVKTIAHRAVSSAIRHHSIAEELRVLYVALTRARERLLLVGSVKDMGAHALRWAAGLGAAGWALPDYMLARARHPLDWLGPAVARHAHGAPLRHAAVLEGAATDEVACAAVLGDKSRWRVTLWNQDEWQKMQRHEPAGQAPAVTPHLYATGTATGYTIDPNVADQLEQALAGTYAYSGSVEQGAKVSATLLARELFQQAADEEATVMQPLPRGTDTEFFTPRLAGPAFVDSPAQPTPAERGTALHTLLYHLDITVPVTLNHVAQTADRLVNNHLLTPMQRAVLDEQAVCDYFQSEHGQRLRRASIQGALWREWAFTLGVAQHQLPNVTEAERSSPWAPDDVLLVQGKIDALWEEEGRLYIADYKTDRVTSLDELRQRYEAQLRVYALAVSRITKRTLSGVYLVHLRERSAVLEVRV